MLSDPRLSDFATFLGVSRYKSITRAARDLGVTPSQVSKAVVRLEKHFGHALLQRTTQGVNLTEAARALVPKLEAAVRALSPQEQDESRCLAVVAPSYLAVAFLPAMAASPALQGTRLRAIEAGPAYLRALASQSAFQAAITLGAERLPPTWVSARVASTRRGLFGPPEVAKALGAQPCPEDVARFPFVTPVYNSMGEILPGDDGCPLGRDLRKVGHEASTIHLALRMAATSGQLAFGPVIAAAPLLESGALVEIPVLGWDVVDDLYLHSQSERVLAREHAAMAEALRSALIQSSLEATPPNGGAPTGRAGRKTARRS